MALRSVSRRRFLKDSLASSAVLACGPLACSRGRNEPAGGQEQSPGGFVDFEPAYLEIDRQGELGRREQLLWEVLKECRLCPRACKVNRLSGQSKTCRSDHRLKVHSAGAHFGEEPPLVGRGGSGTIFFSNCCLLCCFCQNWQIAHRGDGWVKNHRQLAEAMLKLQRRGCHNINLVTPTHVVPHIVRALRYAIDDGLRLPLVYNTGGYDQLEIIKLLDGIVDIYLPDFKYGDGEMSHKYSQGAGDYPEVAQAAIKEMHRQVGKLQTDARGIAKRGLIVRHLVMPNNVSGTDKVLRWVARELSPDTWVNLMDQYRPAHQAFNYPEIARRLTREEWRQARAWAREAGLANLVS